MINVTRDGEWLLVDTDYNADFVSDLKRHVPHDMRRWDADNKQWRVSIRVEDVLLDILKNIFGYAPGAQTVAIRITALCDVAGDMALVVCGKTVAKIQSRDSGAKIGAGVIMKNGSIGSAGSRAHPYAYASAGTIFEFDVFEDAIEFVDLLKWCVQKISRAESNNDELMVERTKLLARIQEIDVLLKSSERVVSVFDQPVVVHDDLKD